MPCVLSNRSPEVSDSIRDADKLGGLVEDIRNATMYYHVRVSYRSSPPCQMPAPDPTAKGYTYNKTCQLIVSLTPQPSDCGLTNGQESADLALLDRTYHIADTGYRCGNREVERWLTGEQKQHIFWLGGLAGTGQSTIARTFAETSFAEGQLGAGFFCLRGFEDQSSPEAISPKGAAPLKVTQPHTANLSPIYY